MPPVADVEEQEAEREDDEGVAVDVLLVALHQLLGRLLGDADGLLRHHGRGGAGAHGRGGQGAHPAAGGRVLAHDGGAGAADVLQEESWFSDVWLLLGIGNETWLAGS